MLKSFNEFLKEEAQVLEESVGGSKSNHNGALSEIAFTHTLKRYAELRNNGTSHEDALHHLSTGDTGRPIRQSSVQPGSEYHSRMAQAKAAIGHTAAQRTLWDAHHAALHAIDHIHNKVGTIERGSVMWTAPDASGEMTKKATGHNTPADVVFRVRKHNGTGHETVRLAHSDAADDSDEGHEDRKWHGTSLKYSETTSKDPTKLRAHGYNSLNKIIQQAHREVHGTEHDGLNRATQAMSQGNKAAEQDVLAQHHDFLHSVFGVNPKPGQGPVLRGSSPAIFRHDTTTGQRSLNPRAHAYLKGLAKGDYDGPSGPSKTGPMGWTEHEHKAGAQAFLAAHAQTQGDPEHYRNQVHAALESISSGKSDHAKSIGDSKRQRVAGNLYRNLANIPESRSKAAMGAKTYLVSIKSRRKEDGFAQNKRQKPDVDITDPSARVSTYFRDARRKGKKPTDLIKPRMGGGKQNLRVGRLNMSVDTKVKGMNTHMDQLYYSDDRN